MAKYFDLEHLDDVIGGVLPEDGMWSFEGYEARSKVLEKKFSETLAAAAAAQMVEGLAVIDSATP